MNKKILILGATYNECDIVRTAKELGYWTIVTDNHTDWNLSPAKKEADEAWNVSWSEIETLYEKCLEENVRGVIAGFSEFRVENMIKLCARLHSPCMLTMEQLDITRNKVKFKNTCRHYGIPCVNDYELDDKISYPVIIKPVDRAGSIGINVAANAEELNKYYKIALDLSPSKEVIIEDFIQEGIKVDVYYFVVNGEATLLGTSDTVMCTGTDGAKILQKAWTFPSVFENQYKIEMDGLIKRMLVGIGIQFGYATISLFYSHEHFYVFEAGFRLSGDCSYNYYRALAEIDYLKMLVKYSMNDFIPPCTDARFVPNAFSVILNFFGKDGVVGRIQGWDEISSRHSIISGKLFVRLGEKIENQTSVLKKVAMITLFSKNIKEILDDILFINQKFKILDSEGNDLIYERVHLNNSGLLQSKTTTRFFVLK